MFFLPPQWKCGINLRGKRLMYIGSLDPSSYIWRRGFSTSQAEDRIPQWFFFAERFVGEKQPTKTHYKSITKKKKANHHNHIFECFNTKLEHSLYIWWLQDCLRRVDSRTLGNLGILPFVLDCPIFCSNSQDRWRQKVSPTSSTAKTGSGGSFKSRKSIGEICCCESRMEKQKHLWMDLSNWLTVSLFNCLPD